MDAVEKKLQALGEQIDQAFARWQECEAKKTEILSANLEGLMEDRTVPQVEPPDCESLLAAFNELWAEREQIQLAGDPAGTPGEAKRVPGRPRRADAYALPFKWGPWKEIEEHTGPMRYEIGADAVGGTAIQGEVKYWGTDGESHTEPLRGTTTIDTGDVVGKVRVRFKGAPFGSAVRVESRTN